MSITKSKKGTWEFSYSTGKKIKSKNGNSRYEILHRRGFETKKEAEEVLHALKQERSLGYKSSKQSFRDYVDWWFPRHKLSSTKGKPLSKRTAKAYSMMIENHLKLYFGSKEIAEIEPIDIEDYLHDKTTEGKSNTTLKHHYRLLSLIFDSAVRRSLIMRNPVKLIRSPQTDKLTMAERNTQVLAVEDQQKLMAQAKYELQDVTYFTYTSYILALLGLRWGLRLSELLALKWSDITNYIDGESIIKLINIQRAVDIDCTFKSTKSLSGERTIPISADLFQELLTYKSWLEEFKSECEDWEDNDLMIPGIRTRLGKGSNGGIQTTQRVGQQMRRLFDRAEVKISMHGLRHTCITNWLAEDVPLKMVSTLAGHSSIAITLDRYGHVLESDSVKFMDKLYSRMLG